MTGLVVGIDAAYPPAVTIIPASARVVLGYAGDVTTTPHVWTRAEVDAVRATGRAWWPIWTMPERALTASDGEWAAAGMTAALPGYAFPVGCPVFLDIESAAWYASPAGARAAVTAWQQGMAAAGWPRAYPYLPAPAGYGWLADWTGIPPATLPAGVVGVQYDHALAGDAYDISVFDPSLLSDPPGPAPDPPGGDMFEIIWVEGVTAEFAWSPSGAWWQVPNPAYVQALALSKLCAAVHAVPQATFDACKALAATARLTG